MGWKEFVASVIGSTAWPAVLLAVVLLVLGPLRRLIARIRTWDGFGVKAELAEDLYTTRRWVRAASQEVSGSVAVVSASGGSVELAGPKEEAETDAPGARTGLDVKDQEELNRKVYELAAGLDGEAWETEFARPSLGAFPSVARTIAAPVMGIRESWDALGNFISAAAKAHRGDQVGPRSMPKILAELQQAGLVGDSFIQAVLGLWKIRNEVISGEVSPGPQEAVEYRHSARSLHTLAQRVLDVDRNVDNG